MAKINFAMALSATLAQTVSQDAVVHSVHLVQTIASQLWKEFAPLLDSPTALMETFTTLKKKNHITRKSLKLKCCLSNSLSLKTSQRLLRMKKNKVTKERATLSGTV